MLLVLKSTTKNAVYKSSYQIKSVAYKNKRWLCYHMEVLFSYGKRDGKIVHISEIGPEANGKRCGCVCPACGGALMAEHGNGGKRPHFSHMAETDCDSARAQQTGLHLLAKEILAENNEIRLPGWEIKRNDVIPAEGDSSVYPFVEIELPSSDQVLCEYDSVEIEKAVPGIVADAVITIKGRACAVEIAVSHFVDDLKQRKTENLRLPMFEIDLSDMIDETDRNRITDAVLYYHYNRKWIYNPKQAAALHDKREEFRRTAEKLSEDEKRKAAWKQSQKDKNTAALKDAFQPDSYARIVRGLRNDKEAASWLKWFFGKDLYEYPFYMDIPITGEFVFSCDRRIWQAKLFKDYVLDRFGNDPFQFTISDIQKRIYKGKLFIKYDKPMTMKASVIIGGVERGISLSFDVIEKYFEYLELLGFVSRAGYEWYSRPPASLKPPNEKEANTLAEILAGISPFSANIDSIIEKELQSRLPCYEVIKRRL